MLHIGSSYYLLQTPESEWEADFAQMAEAGHNTVRTGELISSWEMIEPHPGQHDFSSLDCAFELCAKHGMKLLLGTGACSPPLWLHKQHSDICILDRDNNPYMPGAMWGWACINHPAYLEACDSYLAKLLERYGEHPQLLGWQIHNEPGFPFVPRADRAKPDWFDYNPHAVACFRKWLERRYGTIAKLNEAWRWIPTSAKQLDFDSIDAPRKTPVEWGVPQAWMDWRRFCYGNWNGLISRQHKQIKAATPHVPTMVNMFGAGYDVDGRLGADSWTLPRQVDAIGFDMYPGPRIGANSGFASWLLDFAQSTARSNERPLWLPELEAGPLGGWAAGPAHPTGAREIRRWGLQSLSRGAKMLLYQGYRDWRNLPLNWTGLAGWEGEGTDRLAASAQLASLMREHADSLDTATVPQAQIGILHDQDNSVFCSGSGVGDLAHAALEQFHRALNRIGYTVDFVAAAHADSFSGYAAIILPFTVMLGSECAKALAEYVERGGNLISFARTGMVDENCQVPLRRPGGLTEVLGVVETGTEAACSAPAAWVDASLPGFEGCFQRQSINAADGVEVLARFEKGNHPALTKRSLGKGSACHFATHLAMPQDGSALKVLLAKLGIKSEFTRDGANELDVRKLAISDASSLLFFANEGNDAIETSITCDGLKLARIRNLWPYGDFSLTDSSTIMVMLPAGEAGVIELTHQ